MRRGGTLYVSYFGLREPLVQTQVIPYLRELARAGYEVHLLTFERDPAHWSAVPLAEAQARLRSDGIEWHRATYRSRPRVLAKVVDLATGIARTIRLVRKHRLDVVHGRSDVGAAIGLVAKLFTGVKVVYDIRALLADEYAESGNWKAGGVLHRITRSVESLLYRYCDGFVVVTARARDEILHASSGRDRHGHPVVMVPCCVDAMRFAAAGEDMRAALGLRGRNVLVYAGSLGGGYLSAEVAEFVAVAHTIDPSIFALILTHSPAEPVLAELERRGLGEGDARVMYVEPALLPQYLRAADAGLSFVKPGPSRLGMSPTKFAEYLAAGIPVVSTRGIGDLDRVIEEEGVGVLVDRLDAASYREAFLRLMELKKRTDLAERCRDLARSAYDVEAVGGARYVALYESLLQPEAAE